MTGTHLVRYYPPQWILDKIFPVWSSVRIEVKQLQAFNDDWSHQDFDVTLSKSDEYIYIDCNSTITMDKTRSFRIQFDLLIDID